MKKVLLVVLLFASSSAFAATAYWTGRMEQIQTVTFQMGWNCEYNYQGQIFWRVFINSCPSTIEIQ